jgi:hypothetical protein
MNFPSFMTIKDFFNYYVSGFIWLVCIGLLWLPIQDHVKLVEKLDQLQAITDKLSTLVLALALLIFPYVIGFIFTPINGLFTKLLRFVFGDPKKWVVDHHIKSKWQKFLHEGKRLSRTNIRLVTQRLKEIYGDEKEISEAKIAKWFFQIRAIVINQKGEAGALAIRAQDLANFTESILLPVPLLFIILFGKFLQINPAFAWLCLGIGLVLFGTLSKRYLDMRTFWVKHTYRAFLALLATDKQKLDLTDQGE